MDDWDPPEIEVSIDGFWLGAALGLLLGAALSGRLDALSVTRRRLVFVSGVSPYSGYVVTRAADVVEEQADDD